MVIELQSVLSQDIEAQLRAVEMVLNQHELNSLKVMIGGVDTGPGALIRRFNRALVAMRFQEMALVLVIQLYPTQLKLTMDQLNCARLLAFRHANQSPGIRNLDTLLKQCFAPIHSKHVAQLLDEQLKGCTSHVANQRAQLDHPLSIAKMKHNHAMNDIQLANRAPLDFNESTTMNIKMVVERFRVSSEKTAALLEADLNKILAKTAPLDSLMALLNNLDHILKNYGTRQSLVLDHVAKPLSSFVEYMTLRTQRSGSSVCLPTSVITGSLLNVGTANNRYVNSNIIGSRDIITSSHPKVPIKSGFQDLPCSVLPNNQPSLAPQPNIFGQKGGEVNLITNPPNQYVAPVQASRAKQNNVVHKQFQEFMKTIDLVKITNACKHKTDARMLLIKSENSAQAILGAVCMYHASSTFTMEEATDIVRRSMVLPNPEDSVKAAEQVLDNVQSMSAFMIDIMRAAQSNCMTKVCELIGKVSAFRVHKQALSRLLVSCQVAYDRLKASNGLSIDPNMVNYPNYTGDANDPCLDIVANVTNMANLSNLTNSNSNGNDLATPLPDNTVNGLNPESSVASPINSDTAIATAKDINENLPQSEKEVGIKMENCNAIRSPLASSENGAMVLDETISTETVVGQPDDSTPPCEISQPIGTPPAAIHINDITEENSDRFKHQSAVAIADNQPVVIPNNQPTVIPDSEEPTVISDSEPTITEHHPAVISD